jgi:hypothetical protein
LKSAPIPHHLLHIRRIGDERCGQGKRQHFVRPIHKNADDSGSYDHKEFDWMVLKDLLTQMPKIEKVVGSPLDWLTPHFASQVWFLAHKKA